MASERIGDRIKVWRRRRGGMTQRVLADLSGLTQSYISQIESGRKPLDRRSTQVAIASALNISVGQLLGQPGDQDDPVRARAMAQVPAIRSALIELAAGERRQPARDRDALRRSVRELTDLRNAGDYAAVTAMLPDLLRDLGGNWLVLAPELMEALFQTQVTLKNIGYKDLSREAAHLNMLLAKEYDQPAWLGQAWHAMVLSFPVENADLGRRLAIRAGDALHGAPGRPASEAYGFLHLLAGLHAATANRAAEAWAHLAEAASVAARLGEPERWGRYSGGFQGCWFGPANVDCWRMALAAELRDAGTATSVARRADLDAVASPTRQVYLWTDTARALAAGGRDADAMHALVRAERVAPQHFRCNPVAADLAATLVRRAKRRANAEELMALARTIGLDNLEY